jgi:hypothetical protein
VRQRSKLVFVVLERNVVQLGGNLLLIWPLLIFYVCGDVLKMVSGKVVNSGNKLCLFFFILDTRYSVGRRQGSARVWLYQGGL